MKKIVIYLMAIMPILGFTSCENDEPENPVYHDIEIDSVEIDGVTYDFEWVCSDDFDYHLGKHYDEPVVFARKCDKDIVEVSFKDAINNEIIYDKELVELKLSCSWVDSRIFEGCSKLQKVTFHNGIRRIMPYNYSSLNNIPIFRDCKSLKDIYLDKEFNYTLEIYLDLGCDYETVTLHVRKGTKAQWKTMEPWSKFRNIVEDL